MIKARLMKFCGHWMSRALLGPVRVHGCAPDRREASVDIVLIPHRLSAIDCWLLWSRLKRPPVFYQDGHFSRCLGYRVGKSTSAPLDDASTLDRQLACLRLGQTLVISVQAQSGSALQRLKRRLASLQSQCGDLTLQLLTFNYDFRHALGSPVHWIWRPKALDLANVPLDLTHELQALQKLAWSISGYQSLQRVSTLSPAGRIPSSLLLSWHEVRARRRLHPPSLATWPWIPLALLTTLLNLAPLTAAYLMAHQQEPWRVDRLAGWLVPLYLINHLIIAGLVMGWTGGLAWLYLPCFLMGVHPVGRVAALLVKSEDSAEIRSVRERILNYFD